ncbi:MAG: hypothetical protein LBI79_05520 [Nitrososphaerota archaeon]|nr:hypothetical protein [Nitrososphaerota archaeon]
MSELVQTLWFEDVGFLNEPMLDTPLGRFSIRQMGFFLLFGFLAWLVSLVFVDLVLKIVVAGVIFFIGAALFTRKIKTLPLEVHLFYLVSRRYLQIKQKSPKPQSLSLSVGQDSKPMLLSATLGVPIKIVGVLKDLVTEKPLSSKNFKVNINNTAHSKGATDQEGFFCTYFIPDRLGRFQIDIQPEGSTEPLQQITLIINPKTEVTENAETKT